VASHPLSGLTEEEYLAIERAAEFRSEFLNGEMFAMSGGTMPHAILQGNLYGELYTRLHGGSCRAFTSDFRVKASAAGMYTYPDVSVVCGRPVLADKHKDILLNPVVIVEVLSPSTEKYDRGLKFQNYRTIESLKDYILVDQEKIRIEQYIRHTAGWTLRDYQHPDEELQIDSIGVSIPLRQIYEGVEFGGS
jgi:Uma2 family endonuclease